MGRGLGHRAAALAAAVALALVTGGVVTTSSSDPSPRRTEVGGVVHLRDGLPGSDDPAIDRISRLRRPPAEVSATAGDATALAAPSGDAVIAPPPESFEAAPEPPAPPPRTLRSDRWAGVTPSGGTWALVIGINDYPGSRHDLRSAVADAEDVNTALASLGVPGENRVVLRDREANRATIVAGLDWLTAHAGPDAVAVVFYAGHVRKLGSGVEAIVASDGALMTDGELANELTRLQARRSWIGIAACYAGGFTEVRAPGRILTGAAPAHSLAYENADFGRSYMVEYMVRRAMIERRADGSVEAAFGFAHRELERDYPNRLPVQYDWHDGDLDLQPPNAERSSSPPPTGSDDEPPPPDDGSSDTDSDSGSGDSGDSGDDDSGDDGDTCSSLTLIVSCRDDD